LNFGPTAVFGIQGQSYCEEAFASWISYQETFAQVRRLNQHGFEGQQMDVKIAYLYGDLKDEICMKQPDGFVQSSMRDSHSVMMNCKSNKKVSPQQEAKHAMDTFIPSSGSNRHGTSADSISKTSLTRGT
jgi:hypothetical protein